MAREYDLSVFNQRNGRVKRFSQPNVLIFDSGVGGLSVFQEIKNLLPTLNYYYVFDNEAYPYGELSQETLIARVNALVVKMTQQFAIDLVVIACNTASTIVLPSLRSALAVPVVGVVPAIKPASLLASRAVGLIATPATVTRQYTHDLIRDFVKEKEVELLGSTRLVDIAEEKLRGRAIDLQELSDILQPMRNKVDVAVLGCTHFPLIKEEIQQVLGEEIALVDSGQAIARRVQALLPALEAWQNNQTWRIFSTAQPWEEQALNRSVMDMGFNPIEMYPLPEISDR
ncbi:glutamate racemase [Vibrio navarrensis]|uniref:Glutamate racemase n=1 Tax=Vibrio navarrensis TaxID=29495 RepID=A0AAJ4IEP4_9VIBR|nr:glutamate racemase [Vibrio navarrensis]MBE3654343.1 glutamate racemase [Vibrio navarrensis]MBE3658759.1 glutamate racemase [Vibrio navarrensis]MBE3662472.1 glutamate racemase [Vibrio navarrensis]MBE3671355.1 glutamate racemase [Vibrio navarrensis]MBE4594671.1 glutamate racemase [Vibrio navarrensis]